MAITMGGGIFCGHNILTPPPSNESKKYEYISIFLRKKINIVQLQKIYLFPPCAIYNIKPRYLELGGTGLCISCQDLKITSTYSLYSRYQSLRYQSLTVNREFAYQCVIHTRCNIIFYTPLGCYYKPLPLNIVYYDAEIGLHCSILLLEYTVKYLRRRQLVR